MRVLVTGANGLLGHHVVLRLLQEGHEVHIIVRSLHRIYFDLTKIKCFIGDFCNEQLFTNAATHCDALVHIAAITATNLLHFNNYRSINVDANRMILNVCSRLKINNIVFVSSSNTIGYGSEFKLASETASFRYPFTNSFYAQSKLLAESFYLEASNDPDKHIVIINPGFLIGAYDVKPSSGRLVLMGWRKRLVFIPNGGKSFVAASDVAICISKALVHGSNGEKYLVTGPNLSFKDFYQLLSRVGAYRQKIVVLPSFFLRILARFGDLLQFFGLQTDLCSRNINQLLIREYYSSTKAIHQLAHPCSSLEQSVLECVEWLNINNK